MDARLFHADLTDGKGAAGHFAGYLWLPNQRGNCRCFESFGPFVFKPLDREEGTAHLGVRNRMMTKQKHEFLDSPT